jgi:hypothetical protein
MVSDPSAAPALACPHPAPPDLSSTPPSTSAPPPRPTPETAVRSATSALPLPTELLVALRANASSLPGEYPSNFLRSLSHPDLILSQHDPLHPPERSLHLRPLRARQEEQDPQAQDPLPRVRLSLPPLPSPTHLLPCRSETACPIVGSASYLYAQSTGFSAFRSPMIPGSEPLGGYEWYVPPSSPLSLSLTLHAQPRHCLRT